MRAQRGIALIHRGIIDSGKISHAVQANKRNSNVISVKENARGVQGLLLTCINPIYGSAFRRREANPGLKENVPESGIYVNLYQDTWP